MTTQLLVPNLDTFAARLAAIEHEHGWNHKEAARECGFPAATWRSWIDGKHPQNYDAVCRQISERAILDAADESQRLRDDVWTIAVALTPEALESWIGVGRALVHSSSSPLRSGSEVDEGAAGA